MKKCNSLWGGGKGEGEIEEKVVLDLGVEGIASAVVSKQAKTEE